MQGPQELLLVEDDAVTREVLTLLLSNDGWTVHPAEDGEAAIALLEKLPSSPSLVLCDQKLPGLSGTLLASEIRRTCSRQGGPSPVLLAMTATRAAACAGYDDILIKPFTEHELRHAFENVSGNAELQKTQDAISRGDSVPAVAVIDESVFLKLEAGMGAGPLRDLYGFALTDGTGRLKRMEAARTEMDLATVATEAHMLKGAAGMVGAQRLAELAAEIEMLCAGENDGSEFLATKLVMVAAALADIPLRLETLFPVRP